MNCSQCGETVEVPSFSQVKRLEVVVVDDLKNGESGIAPKTDDRSMAQAFTFAAGLLMILLGGIGAIIFVVMAWSVYREPPVLDGQRLKEQTTAIENMSPAKLEEAWKEHVITDEPGEYVPHFYHSHKLVYDNYRMFASLFGGLAAVGLLVLAASFLLRKSQPGK